MNFRIMLILLGLILIAIIFSAIHFNLAAKRNTTFRRTVALGLSKVLSDISIGLIIAAIPTILFLNYLQPQPEDVMPAFAYNGAYTEIADSDIDSSLVELWIFDCTVEIEQNADVEKYFDRAFLYFRTGNLDLAYSDLQKCIELEENWMYYYDMGVVYGYFLDYATAIEFFETALTMDIPISERGTVISALTMIENYYNAWAYSLIR